MTPAARKAAWCGLGIAVAASRWCLRAKSPDSFDAIGFLLGMSGDFDLARLQPHFPGYPVYIALGAALCRLGATPLTAAAAISAVASGVASVALATCAAAVAGKKAALPAALLHAVAWQPLLLGSGAQSESLAMALALLGFALVAAGRPLACGAVAGLVLGTRLSYWPLAAVMVVLAMRRAEGARRWGAPAGLVAAVLAWGIPFAWRVGPAQLWRLGMLHLAGHFQDWGGSVLTRPDLSERLRAFVRGSLYDGLAPNLACLAWAIGVTKAAALGRRGGTRRAQPIHLGLMWALLPYAAWAFVAQNVVAEPRHLLPVAEALLIPLAWLLADSPLATAAVLLGLSFGNLPLALERRRTPPAADQAAQWVEAGPSAHTLVMAGRSSRFFAARAIPVHEHAFLSEALVDLGRLDVLPERVLVTSEVAPASGGALPRPWRLTPVARFCRDARIDRREPCLALSQLTWSPSP